MLNVSKKTEGCAYTDQCPLTSQKI